MLSRINVIGGSIIMARKAKRSAKKKAGAKKPAKAARKGARPAKKSGRAAKKGARPAKKAARRKSSAKRPARRGIVRRVVDAISQAAAPIMPGGGDDRPKDDQGERS